MSLQSDPFTATHPSMSKTTTLFDIPPHYLLLMPIGQGSYGLVYSAFNLLTLQIVAVKKIANALENISDARKVLREIAILKKIKHPNIIALKEVSMASEHSKDVYMYYELMDTDLKKLIRWKAISNDYIQYFVYQLLIGMNYLHSANVLHRDLKPENIFLNASCDLKIGDLGFARSKDQNMTNKRVVSLYYRAPELLLCCKNYGTSIDVWSLGCIFAEMLEKKTIFRGTSEIDQVMLILETLGTPKEEDLEFIDNRFVKEYIKSLPLYKVTTGFSDRYPSAEPLAIDLLEKMLVFDPRKRISVAEALKHPYMAGFYEPHVDLPATFTIDVAGFDRLSEVDEIKKRLMDEVLHF